jgi:hypothetical protein
VPASGYVQVAIEAGITPDLCVYAPGEYIGGIPDILKSNVKRCETKAHDVRRPEIADNATLEAADGPDRLGASTDDRQGLGVPRHRRPSVGGPRHALRAKIRLISSRRL